jgi:hypothetical protein
VQRLAKALLRQPGVQDHLAAGREELGPLLGILAVTDHHDRRGLRQVLEQRHAVAQRRWDHRLGGNEDIPSPPRGPFPDVTPPANRLDAQEHGDSPIR